MTTNEYFESKFPKLKLFHAEVKKMELEHKITIQDYISYSEPDGRLFIVVNNAVPGEMRNILVKRFNKLLHNINPS